MNKSSSPSSLTATSPSITSLSSIALVALGVAAGHSSQSRDLKKYFYLTIQIALIPTRIALLFIYALEGLQEIYHAFFGPTMTTSVVAPPPAEPRTESKQEETQQHEIDDEEEQPFDFTGAFKLISNENYIEFLTAQGVPWAFRGTLNRSRPIHRYAHRGRQLTMKIEGILASNSTYTLGGPSVKNEICGRTFEDRAKYTPGGIFILKTGVSEKYDVEVAQKLSPDKNSLTITQKVILQNGSPPVEAVQVFERVPDTNPLPMPPALPKPVNKATKTKTKAAATLAVMHQEAKDEEYEQPFDFTGAYKLVSNENYTEFLTAQGVPWAFRGALNRSRPIHRYAHHGRQLTMKIEGILASHSTYTLGGPSVKSEICGRIFEDRAKYTPGAIFILKTGITEKYDVEVTQKLSPDKNSLTITQKVILRNGSPPVQAVQVFERVPDTNPLPLPKPVKKATEVKAVPSVAQPSSQPQRQSKQEYKHQEEEKEEEPGDDQRFDFTGAYKLVSNENYTEFLTAQGVPWAFRGALNRSRPIHRYAHRGRQLTMKIEGILASNSTYTLGGAAVKSEICGRTFEDRAKYTPGGIFILKTGVSEKYDVEVTQKLSPDKNILTITQKVILRNGSPPVEAVQVFERVPDTNPLPMPPAPPALPKPAKKATVSVVASVVVAPGIGERQIERQQEEEKKEEEDEYPFDMTGDYKLVSNDNYMDFLAAQGVPWAFRVAVNRARPNYRVTHLGRELTVKMEGILASKTNYIIGGPSVRSEVCGRKFEDRATFQRDGIRIQKTGITENYDLEVFQKLSPDKRQIIMTQKTILRDGSKPVKAVQIFERIE